MIASSASESSFPYAQVTYRNEPRSSATSSLPPRLHAISAKIPHVDFMRHHIPDATNANPSSLTRPPRATPLPLSTANIEGMRTRSLRLHLHVFPLLPRIQLSPSRRRLAVQYFPLTARADAVFVQAGG